MNRIGKLYCKDIRRNFIQYYGNWQPTDPIRLGDIGLVNQDGIFEYVTNITELIDQAGISNSIDDTFLRVERMPDIGDINYKSNKGVEIAVDAPAENEAPTIQVTFRKENGTLIIATNCHHERYLNKGKVAAILAQCHEKGIWKDKYVIVTSLVRAEKATVLMSTHANTAGVLDIHGDDNIEDASIAQLFARATLRDTNNFDYHVVGANDIVPFFCLAKLRDTKTRPSVGIPLLKNIF